MAKLTAALRKQIREARNERRRAEIARHKTAYLSLEREQRSYRERVR